MRKRLFTLLLCFIPYSVWAQFYWVEGQLTVNAYVGAACEQANAKAGDRLNFTAVFEIRGDQKVTGLMTGPRLAWGQFSGPLGQAMAYQLSHAAADNETGHSLRISLDRQTIQIEIRERPPSATTFTCNRALAIFEGPVKEIGPNAQKRFAELQDSINNQRESILAQRRDPKMFEEAQAMLVAIRQAIAEKNHALAADLLSRRQPLLQSLYGANHGFVIANLDNWTTQSRLAGRQEEAVRVQALALVAAEHNATRLSAPPRPGVGDEAQANRINEASAQALKRRQGALATQRDLLSKRFEKEGHWDKAQEQAEHALALALKAYGEQHEQTAVFLANLSELLFQRGRFSDALPLAIRSAQIEASLKGPEDPELSRELERMAKIYLALGDAAQALVHQKRALAIDQKAFGIQHEKTALRLNTFGSIYRSKGDYAEAVRHFEQSLKISTDILGERHVNVWASLNNLGLTRSQQGLFSESLRHYQKALALALDLFGKSDRRTALSYQNLGGVYLPLGKNDLALEYQSLALGIHERALGPNHPATISSLNDLVATYSQLARWDDAEREARRAVEATQVTFGPDHPTTGIRLNNLAFVLKDRGNTQAAIPIFERALAIATLSKTNTRPAVVSYTGNLASSYQQLKQHDKALPLFIDAYLLSFATGNALSRIEATRNLAWHLGLTGQLGLAVYFGKKTVNELQILRETSADLSPELRRGLAERNEGIYFSLSDWLIALQRLDEAEQVLEMLKDRELYLITQRNSGKGLSAMVLTTNERALEARLPLSPRGSDPGDATLSEARSKLTLALNDGASGKLNLASPAVSATGSAGKMQAILGRIGPSGKTVGLAYSLTELRLSIVLTTDTGSVARQIPIRRADVLRLITQFRTSLMNPSIDPRPSSQALYRLLIAPIEPELKAAAASGLAVNLSGALRYIPFSALHDGEKYLIEKMAVAIYTPAGGIEVKATAPQSWQVAGFGLTQAVSGFSALPGVQQELEAIVRSPSSPQGSVPGTLLLDQAFNRSALEKAFQSQVPVLHIASHFQFTPGSELASFLLLGDGSRVALSELKDLDLRQIHLLTLSACNTASGGGFGENGAEVEGLGAALQVAGARAVLASLWEVSDTSTAVLMQKFYQLRTGPAGSQLTSSEGMRQAQLALLRGAGSPVSSADTQARGARVTQETATGLTRFAGDPAKPFAHPFYWAAFILMGNWL